MDRPIVRPLIRWEGRHHVTLPVSPRSQYRTLYHCVMSRDVLSRGVTSCHVVWRHVTWWGETSRDLACISPWSISHLARGSSSDYCPLTPPDPCRGHFMTSLNKLLAKLITYQKLNVSRLQVFSRFLFGKGPPKKKRTKPLRFSGFESEICNDICLAADL
jgi:hypothetical protein